MSFLDCFAEEMNRTYTSYPKNTDLDTDDELIEGFSSTAEVEDEKCMYLTRSQAESLLSDRYKTPVVGVIVSKVKPVTNESRIVLSTGENFLCVKADDVGFQGDVMLIQVTTEDYGRTI